MPSVLGLHLHRFDPTASKPLRGWCNDLPSDDSEAEAEWDDYIRQHASTDSNQFDHESIAGLDADEASEAAIEDEIEKSQKEALPEEIGLVARKYRRKAVPTFHALPVRVANKDATPANKEGEDIVKKESDEAREDEDVAVDAVARKYLLPDELEDDFDDDLIFALTPETCPGPPPSPRLLPEKTPLRIFVATWNMAAEDPFAHRRRGPYIGDDLAADALQELLPPGYDMYVVGTQEKVTKHLHTAVLARLNKESSSSERTYQRLALASKRQRGRSREEERRHRLRTLDSFEFGSSLGLSSFDGSEIECSPNSASVCSINSPNASFSCGDELPSAPHSAPLPVAGTADSLGCSWWGKEREEKEIRGHGDHAFIRRKSTGLSVYYASHLDGRIEAVAAGSHKFTGSKGGIAVTVRVAGDPQTLTFVNCHLEANRLERRRRQLDKLSRELPRALALGDSSLATCSDHVVWMGDFNYRIQSLDGDEVLRLLSAGRLQELHDHYDSMADDLAQVPGLKAFREPAKWPTFYPTYKKVASRSRLPLSGSTTGTGRDTRWAQHVYQTTFREPFYKGGRLRERVPGWCDRILYCSRAPSPWEDCLQVEQAACSDVSRGASSFTPEAVRDNYRSLNDELRGSDHSPVSCAFLWSVQR
jgi:hypothetical protein